MAVCVSSPSQDRGEMLNLSSALRLQQGLQTAGTTGGLQNLRNFNNQDFEHLRSLCLSQGLLFEDDIFPADTSSIGPNLLPKDKLQQIEWKRPRVSFMSPGVLYYCCWMWVLMPSSWGKEVCAKQENWAQGEHWERNTERKHPCCGTCGRKLTYWQHLLHV